MKIKNLVVLLLSIVGSTMAPAVTHANETGWIKVLQVGGQVSNMFVVFSQPVGTDKPCPNARLILPAGVMDAESLKRFYATMITAMQTGTRVAISVSGCYDQNYPTMISTDYWFAQGP